MFTNGVESEAWLESFSLAAYEPMLCLASGKDRNRRRQRTLIRGYLRNLSADFHRLHAIAARHKSSTALCDRQMGFIFHMWSVEARLLLHTVVPHSINLKPLLTDVETLANEIRGLTQPRMHYQTM